MRKWNAILSAILIAIFLLHGVMSGFLLIGAGENAGKLLAWIGFALMIVHAVFSAVFTAQTIKSGKATGKWYLRQNALFWTRRISGVCILVLAFFHFGLFGREVDGGYILFKFTTARLVTQLLLTAALFTHILTNIRPLLVSLGVLRHKELGVDCRLIISVVLLFCTGAVIFYYVRG
jgi:hypothetical protein